MDTQKGVCLGSGHAEPVLPRGNELAGTIRGEPMAAGSNETAKNRNICQSTALCPIGWHALGWLHIFFRKLESKTNPVSWFAEMEGRGKRNQDCAWRECATADHPGPLRETKVEDSPVGFASPRTAFLIKAFRTKGSGWRDRSPYRLSPCPLGLWGELSRPQGPWSGDRSTCAAANADRSAHSLLIKIRSPCKKSKLSPDDDTGHILTTLFWVVGNV